MSQATEAPKVMFRLKIIAGSHRIGPKYEIKDGKRILVKEGYNINAGSPQCVFESPIDLSKRYPEKFVRVDAVEAEAEDTEEGSVYEEMTLDELKELATTDLGIEFPANVSKKALLKLIKQAESA